MKYPLFKIKIDKQKSINLIKNVFNSGFINEGSEVKKLTKIPIVAIGGINSKNYKKLLLNKANFLAISGYIWNNIKYKPSEAIEKIK